ncbi:MAG: Galactose-1-phosphate uridylyltransferase [Syntrophorhabdus sp. PtaB.Bin047]|jgi:UDPglucose--hexose-1-phosphate uridylyltransferase|nr:MAG: Galactose-1-phosphate uridylyltransferase [Syntrophorhabdus sp. PtaB.Bin047]
MAELRRDPLTGDWVVVGYGGSKSSGTGVCPFCPGHESMTPPTIREYTDDRGDWLVRCFAASNPIFVIEVAEDKRGEGLYDKMGNVGAHEIIVENRSHSRAVSMYSKRELQLVLDMYRDRILDLKGDTRFKHVQVFKNHGELAGSYLLHPHSHVLATPIVPSRVSHEIITTRGHFMQKERCLLCDIINQEVRQGKRLVSMNRSFVAICPFASRFPYETWIVPRFHEANYEDLVDQAVKDDLTEMLLDIMKRIEQFANAYTMEIRTSPNTTFAEPHGDELPLKEYHHWHIEILPRDFRSSKYKREDEFSVLSITPEEAAESMRAQRI